jgi:TonB-dependent Receptor Plug Domain
MRSFYLFTLFVLAFATSANAQNAKLQGKVFTIVKNVETPLPFAKVMILKPDSTVLKGVDTDFDGKYIIIGKPGLNLISVRAAEMRDSIFTVDLVEGDNPELNIQMFDFSITAATAVVIGQKKKSPSTQQGEDNRRKDDVAASDGMSREQIQKTGDSDASRAVQRVPGVSVQDGKYIYVRGLGDRYVKTIMNGVEIPGLDPDRNTVQLDIFPTALIDNIIVYKTFSPNLSGDFTGGLVDIITRDYPSSKELKVNLSLGYNSAATFNSKFIGYKGGNFDFLGFDDGTRALPLSPTQKTYDPSLQDERTTTMTKAFNSQMAFENKLALPNLSFGFSYGNFIKDAFKSENWTYGYLTSFTYRNSNSLNDIASFGNYLRSQNESKTELEPFRVSSGVVAQNDVLWTALFNQTFVYKKKHKYSVGFFHTQNGTSSASSIRENNIEGNQGVLIKQGLQYTQRQVSNLDFKGSHSYLKWKINWVVAPTLSKISDPDLRSTVLEEVTNINSSGETVVTYELNPAVGSEIRRIYRDLDEKSLNSKLNFTYLISLNDSVKSKLEFGVFNLTKERNFNVYDYFFELHNSNQVSLDPNFYFQPENIWTVDNNSGLYVKGQREPANQYVGRQFCFRGVCYE